MNMKQMYLSSAPDISEFWRKDRKTVRSTLHSHLFCTFVFQKIVNAKYDDSGRTFQKLVAHCKEYGFIFPSSEIYDGLGAVYDYGQNGVEPEEQYQALLVGFDGASS